MQRPRAALSLGRTVTEAVWFPLALFLGFLFCFAPALHAPQPHGAEVAVADPSVAARTDAALRTRQPGGFDVTAVAGAREARQAVLDREAVAGYAEGARGPVLYVAKANGMSLEQSLTRTFTTLAKAHGRRLTVEDVAPTVPADLMGTTLVYFAIAWSVPGYLLATTLLRAVSFTRRQKLLVIVGVAALFSVVGNLVGAGLGYLPGSPAAMAVAFLLTTAVATVSSGLAPFVRQFFPAVGMGLFIVLSIPTSGGVAPAPLLPPFFQALHAVMPLANAVDALRGVLYFDGAGVLKPVLVLCAWTAAGAALLGLDARLRHRKAVAVRPNAGDAQADEQTEVAEPPVEDPALETPVPTALPVHRHHFGEPVPMLTGTVHDAARRPVPGAVVTVMDAKGRQLVSTVTNTRGEYATTGLPNGYLTIVATSTGRRPKARQQLLRPGTPAHLDFTLPGREPGPYPVPSDMTPAY